MMTAAEQRRRAAVTPSGCTGRCKVWGCVYARIDEYVYGIEGREKEQSRARPRVRSNRGLLGESLFLSAAFKTDQQS